MINSWLLNIVGIVFVGVILDVVLPEGKTNVFIKHIFSVFMLFVIVSPIVDFATESLNINVNSSVIDSNFIYSNNLEKISALEKSIAADIEESGLTNVSLIINGNIFNEILTFNSVYVDISNVKSKTELTINEIKSIISSKIQNKIDVLEEDIVYYGWANWN